MDLRVNGRLRSRLLDRCDDLLKLLTAECGRSESELDGAMRLTQEPRHPASADMHVGLGWLIRDIGGRRVWWHNGGTGGYTSYTAFCRDPACAVVVLCNSGPDALDEARPRRAGPPQEARMKVPR